MNGYKKTADFPVYLIISDCTVNKEIQEMTLIRSSAILILLLTHLHDYVELWWLWKIYPSTATVCLSLFVFTSGYFLALGRDVENIKSLLCFVRQKIVRIYVLYLPALVIFVALYKHGSTNKIYVFIEHLFSLQLIFANTIHPYFTIWFIGLIVPYYMLYGVSSYLSVKLIEKLKYTIFNSTLKSVCAFMALIFILSKVFSLSSAVDSRLVFYFPAFVTGIYFSYKGYISNRKFKFYTFIRCVLFSMVVLGLYSVSEALFSGSAFTEFVKDCAKVLYVVMIPLSFVFVSQFIVRRISVLPKPIKILSYSAYSIFLFHRPTLSIVERLLSYIDIKNNYILLCIYLMIIIPFIVVPVSYYIQCAADKIMKLLTSKPLKPDSRKLAG